VTGLSEKIKPSILSILMIRIMKLRKIRFKWALKFTCHRSTTSEHFKLCAQSFQAFLTLSTPQPLYGKWWTTFLSSWRRTQAQLINWSSALTSSTSKSFYSWTLSKSTML
jgi:hypothetical protein